MMVNRDIVLVPESVWKLLFKWYGGGPEFERRVILNGATATIELYPPIIRAVLCSNQGQPIQENEKLMIFST